MIDYKKKLTEFVELVIAQGASDLHLGAGVQPVVRVSGNLTPLLSEPVLQNDDVMGLLSEMLSPEHKKRFLETQEIDFSYAYGTKARFRGNGYFERGHVGVALRLISNVIRTVAELNLPPIIETFAAREQGFFLIVGPVGQGKTTTIAALLERVNTTRTEKHFTIQNPIQ